MLAKRGTRACAASLCGLNGVLGMVQWERGSSGALDELFTVSNCTSSGLGIGDRGGQVHQPIDGAGDA